MSKTLVGEPWYTTYVRIKESALLMTTGAQPNGLYFDLEALKAFQRVLDSEKKVSPDGRWIFLGTHIEDNSRLYVYWGEENKQDEDNYKPMGL